MYRLYNVGQSAGPKLDHDVIDEETWKNECLKAGLHALSNSTAARDSIQEALGEIKFAAESDIYLNGAYPFFLMTDSLLSFMLTWETLSDTWYRRLDSKQEPEEKEGEDCVEPIVQLMKLGDLEEILRNKPLLQGQLEDLQKLIEFVLESGVANTSLPDCHERCIQLLHHVQRWQDKESDVGKMGWGEISGPWKLFRAYYLKLRDIQLGLGTWTPASSTSVQ